MMRPRGLAGTTLRTTLFTVVAAFAASHIQAAPIFSSSVQVGAVTFPSLVSDDDSASVIGTTVLGPLTVSITDPVSGASASMTASVDNGVLHANATSDENAAGNAQASFFDTLLLTSDTLAVGTPVQLSLELQFSRTLSGGCPVNGPSTFAFIGTGLGSVMVAEDACNGIWMNQPTLLLDATIGTELQFNAQLLTSTPASSASAVDAIAWWFFTPMDDFTYQTASGLSYIAGDTGTTGEVPEPTTVSLLGLGIGGLSARRWWQRKDSTRY